MNAMEWLLGLHSLLRWLILIFLVINIFRSAVEADKPYTTLDIKWNLRLLIITHINILIGLIQYFTGTKGFAYFSDFTFKEIMRSPSLRFWAVEHMVGMLLAATVITISRTVTKKDWTDYKKHKRQTLLYILALAIILFSIPWPFREGMSSVPWFRGLY